VSKEGPMNDSSKAAAGEASMGDMDSDKATVAEQTESAAAKTVKKGYVLPSPDSEWEKGSSIVEKETEGTITGVNNMGIAVEYAVDKKEGGYEIWFNYTQGIKLEGVENLSEFAVGDTVKVSYREDADKRRVIKEMKLLRKKQKTDE